MNKTLIVANWKMNPQSLAKAKLLFNSVSRGLKGIKDTEIVICPPFPYLSQLPTTRYKLHLGSQDIFWEEKGAFTGEISPQMLKNLGCKYVIIGHSERRKYFKETDEMINRKLKAVIEAKLNPILCIGETQKEKKQGKTQKILKKQLQKALHQTTNYKLQAASLVVAYEPIWAIGTGKACLPAEAKKANIFIRKTIFQIYNQKIAKNTKILYGGSVNSKNAKPYIFEADFQGLLVGGASLNAKEFIQIVKIASRP